MENSYVKVLIIGAGRSGTNMLRDILSSIPGVSTWNCDEINPIWKFGNRNFPSDELEPSMASGSIVRRIKREFDMVAKRDAAQFVIEKTCANSLRVPFVYKVVPDAKFIFINRDGRDVVPSAMKRWKSSLNIRYTLDKMRYVPKRDLFYYLWRFGMNRLQRVVSYKSNLSFWGPIYFGMERDVANLPLEEICAKQWSMCTIKANTAAKLIPDDQRHVISYESFVLEPKKELLGICQFLGIDSSELDLDNFVKDVSNKSVGTHKTVGGNVLSDNVLRLLEKAQKRLNYV